MAIAQPRPTPAPSGRHATISVLVAHREPLTREGAVRACRQQSRLQLIGEAADGRTALKRIAADQPDVAVVDIRLPSLDGAQVLNAVVRDRLPTRVLLLVSASLDPNTAYQVIAAGAAGVLSRRTDAAQLCNAVARVARGEVAFDDEAQTGIGAAIRRRETEQRPLISDWDRDVLLLAAEGFSSTVIGRKLNVSTGTVKACLVRLYARLEASGRTAAVTRAFRRGLIE